jgi:hypothetical protein
MAEEYSTNGLLRQIKTLLGGSGATANQMQGTAADGAAAVGNPVQVAGKDGSGNVQSLLTGTDGSVFVQGAGAHAATTVGNPVLSGAMYLSSTPAMTNGQTGGLQLDTRANLKVTLFDANGTVGVSINSAASDTVTAASANGPVARALGYGFNGTSWDRLRGDTAGLVTQPHALTGSRWNYAAASGGISNTTTAVTIAAAAGASLRNYVTGIQVNATALGAATEIAIRDGAGGAVLWRGEIGTAGLSNGRDIVFPVPLKGTANTLLEVVTLTASVTGAVYFNAQGFTGA